VRITVTRAPWLVVAFTCFLHVNPAFGSSNYKCKKPACDITAIGHRKFFKTPSVGNWYSSDKEKELGDKYAAALEQRVEVVNDAGIMAYVDQVAQQVTQNSDADIPITVRIIRRTDAGAFTLLGGHLFLTTGLS
jgi:predicted Zn-dependent protease